MDNLEKIRDFFLSSSSTLLLNNISEEVNEFYYFLIKEVAEKENIKLVDINKIEDISSNNDLFTDQKIYILKSADTKTTTKISNSNQKLVLFTSYNIFKKINSEYKISSYNYKIDVKNYLSSLDIKEDSLIQFLQDYPYFISSELNKYLLNSNNYFADPQEKGSNEKIKDLRINFYQSRKNKNIQFLYQLIKDEVKYKKLNFLIY